MPASRNIEIQQRFVTAALSGDTEILQSLCHPLFELHEGSGLPFADVYRGAAGFLDFLRIFAEILDVEKLAIVRTYEAAGSDFLACEFELLSSVRATGARFDTSLVEIWQFRDGLVLQVRPHYFDAIR